MNIPNIIKNFLNSEKAIASAVPLIIATVFVLIGKITYAEWTNFAMGITGIYVGGKTIQGAAAAAGGGQAAKKELAELKTKLESNDQAADSSLEDKFKEGPK